MKILTGQKLWDDINDFSVVCHLDTGDIEFLLTGDAEGPAEAALAGDLSSEILKVGHHGSRTSSSSSFLSKVKPEVAVISVGVYNQYGHPAADNLQRLSDAGAKIYRTDINGNVLITTDGNRYNITTSNAMLPTSTVQEQPQVEPQPGVVTDGKYVGSKNSDKYHYPDCRYAIGIAPENQVWFNDAAEAQAAGYVPCKVCRP